MLSSRKVFLAVPARFLTDKSGVIPAMVSLAGGASPSAAGISLGSFPIQQPDDLTQVAIGNVFPIHPGAVKRSSQPIVRFLLKNTACSPVRPRASYFCASLQCLIPSSPSCPPPSLTHFILIFNNFFQHT